MARHHLASLLFVIAGCIDSEPPAGPTRNAPALRNAIFTTELKRPPQRMSQRLSQQLPEFGGAFLDKSGMLNVHITDTTATAITRSNVQAELRRMRRAVTQFRFIKSRFAFRQLQAWETSLLANLNPSSGVTTVAIDEVNNRLEVGIASEEKRGKVNQILINGGIPSDVVHLKITARPVAFTSLVDFSRPLRGGFAIRGIWEQNGQQSTSGCSYGVNVIYTGLRHVVVNSHCTQQGTPGGLIGAAFYQPSPDDDNYAGVEVQDPSFRSDLYGCPVGYLCRYSDAALVRLGDAPSWDHGGIARTASRTTLPTIFGNLLIDGNNPRFEIVDVISELLTGDVVEKVGARTGWTGGTVTQTCIHIFVGSVGRLCNAEVSAGAWHGDSSAPVFWPSFNGNNYLVGILWGGDEEGGTGSTKYWLSNWNFVEWELGTILNDLYVTPIPPPPMCGEEIPC